MFEGGGLFERRDACVSALTEREREVLALMAEGCSNGEICTRLHLSHKTVETHVRRILDKLDLGVDPVVNRRVMAVLMYLQATDPDPALI